MPTLSANAVDHVRHHVSQANGVHQCCWHSLEEELSYHSLQPIQPNELPTLTGSYECVRE